MPIAELDKLDRVLVVGSFLRKDHPLIAHRLRQAAKRGAQIHMLHSVDDDWLMPIAGKKIVAPADLPFALGSYGEIFAGSKTPRCSSATSRCSTRGREILAAANALGVKVGVFGEAANSVGGAIAGLPSAGNVNDVLGKKSIVLLNVEPELDCADSVAARKALDAAEFVVSLTPWKTGLEYADVLLPITPFTESSGTFVNCEGRVQSYHATVNALGNARPGWKVLRVPGEPAWPRRLRARHDRAGARGVPGRQRTLRSSFRTRCRPLAARARYRAFSASPTCRSISPTRSCAARLHCKKRRTHARRALG